MSDEPCRWFRTIDPTTADDPNWENHVVHYPDGTCLAFATPNPGHPRYRKWVDMIAVTALRFMAEGESEPVCDHCGAVPQRGFSVCSSAGVWQVFCGVECAARAEAAR